MWSDEGVIKTRMSGHTWQHGNGASRGVRRPPGSVPGSLCDQAPPVSASGKGWAPRRWSPGLLHSLSVCDFQVTVMFAEGMGCITWDDGVFCSFVGTEVAAVFGINWAVSVQWSWWAEPQKQTPERYWFWQYSSSREALVPCEVRHLGACDTAGQVFSVTCDFIATDREALGSDHS